MEKIGGDVIILQMCTKNLNLMMYGSWDTEWSRKSKFWKNGKTSWNSWNILLCMWTKNKYHMMYDSWNKRCDIQNFWSFWVVFCPFTSLFPPLPPPPPWGIIISQICTINDNGMWNVWNVWFPEIWSTMHRTFCHFGLYFCPFTLPTHSPANYPENQNFEKMKKTPGDLSFYECVP